MSKAKASKKGSLVVAGKTFAYTEGDESELEAYAQARRHLRDLHDKAVARIRPSGVVVTPAPATLSRRDN